MAFIIPVDSVQVKLSRLPFTRIAKDQVDGRSVYSNPIYKTKGYLSIVSPAKRPGRSITMFPSDSRPTPFHFFPFLPFPHLEGNGSFIHPLFCVPEW